MSLSQGGMSAGRESRVSLDYKEAGREISQKIAREGFFTFKKEDLQLKPDDPTVPYYRRSLDEKTVGSWGQFKLFLGILEYICLYHKKSINPKPIVLYIGAAPGLSFPLLSEMFPDFQWDLWDSADFGFEPTEKITINNTYFFDKDALNYTAVGNRIMFMSDIRTIDSRKAERNLVETTIWKDMLMQQEWVKIIKPFSANLKFRLPYGYVFTDKDVRYLSGRVLLQGFTGPTSTETRLVPDLVNGEYEEVSWDIRKYEAQMMYHNAVIREKALYYTPLTNYKTFPDTDDITNNYDGCYMIYVFNLYLDYIGYPVNNYPQGTVEYENYNIERFNSALALSLWVRDYILSKRTNAKSFREIKIYTRRFMEGKIQIDQVNPEDLDEDEYVPEMKSRITPKQSVGVPTVSLSSSSNVQMSPLPNIPLPNIETFTVPVTVSTLPPGFAQSGSTETSPGIEVDVSSFSDLLSDLGL